MSQWLTAWKNRHGAEGHVPVYQPLVYCGHVPWTLLFLQFPHLKTGMEATPASETLRINMLVCPAQGLVQRKTSVSVSYNDDMEFFPCNRKESRDQGG